MISASEFVAGRARAWQRAWMNTPDSQYYYQNNVFGFARCEADAENPGADDHKFAKVLWLRYLEERIAG